MGGYGSGRQWGAAGSARCTVEDTLILDGYIILPKIIKEVGENLVGYRQITWSRNGEIFAKIGYGLYGLILKLNYTINKEKDISYNISLTATPQPKGGLRYWFMCPLKGWGRMTGKLYLPNGALYFGCRKCYNLTYESCNESHRFDSLFRQMGAGSGETLKETEKRLLSQL